MYIVTGNDDVFALDAKTGETLWERWSGIDQKISDRVLRLAQPRLGDGRRDAVPGAARRQRRGARHQDRQGGVEDAGRGVAQRLRSTVTAGGLLLRGEPDGNFVALDAKTGEALLEIPDRLSRRCARDGL